MFTIIRKLLDTDMVLILQLTQEGYLKVITTEGTGHFSPVQHTKNNTHLRIV